MDADQGIATRDPVVALAEEHAALADLLAGLGDEDWRSPTRCDGWDVADVVLHLAQTDELAVASLEGRFDEVLALLADGLGPAADVDDGAGMLVAHQRGAEPEAVHARWRVGAARLDEWAARIDPAARVRWVAGELAARSLITTRLAETWIHAGDVGAGLGVEQVPTDRLWHITRLAWRTLPYAFARDGLALSGPVGFELDSPSGERWSFVEGKPDTTVTGAAADLCQVAARRLAPEVTTLRAQGPDGDAVLRLVRTFA